MCTREKVKIVLIDDKMKEGYLRWFRYVHRWHKNALIHIEDLMQVEGEKRGTGRFKLI